MRRAPLVLSLALSACSDPAAGPAEPEPITFTVDSCPFDAVDILLVIDDSPSMRAHQDHLAANLSALGMMFDTEDSRIDLRVAVVSTSVGGPACAGDPEHAGELLVDSCRAHLDDFVGPGELETDVLDLRNTCLDACAWDAIERRPSPLDEGKPELDQRPWFETRYNVWSGNVDVPLDELLACVGLHGFAGCEFESPIHAASRALERMRTPGDPAYGFLREGVPLLLAFVGDEDDCSHAIDTTIFDPQGERTYWSDPDAPTPTSAVCVNAGIECDSGQCTVVNRDESGALTSDPDRAVLQPLDELRTRLAALAHERYVGVHIVGGFDISGNLQQPTASDPANPEALAWTDEFGAAWACEGGEAGAWRAQTPWRLYGLSEAVELAPPDSIGVEGSTFCAPDLTGGFGNWFGTIEMQNINMWCLPPEVAFRDPQNPDPMLAHEPDCELWLRSERVGDREVPQCMRDQQGWIFDIDTGYQAPPGQGLCWIWRADPGEWTFDVADDLSIECRDHAEDQQNPRPVEVQPQGMWRAPVPRDSHFEWVCRPAPTLPSEPPPSE